MMSKYPFLSDRIENLKSVRIQPARVRMTLIFLAILLPLIGGFVISVKAAEGHVRSTEIVYSNTGSPAAPDDAITLDGAVSSATADDVSSIAFSHTTGTGTDRLTLVGVSWNANTTPITITSVTFSYDSTTLDLTEVGTEEYTSPRYVAIYSLLAPTIGQAGTVTVTFSGSVSAGITAGAANFAGVDQGTPFGVFAGNSGETATEPNVTLTGLAGDELVFDTVFAGGTNPPDLGVGANQDLLWEDGIANTSGGASTEQATGISVTMSWTRTLSTNNYWVIGAVPINPVPTYTLTMAVDPTGGGTTEPAVGDHIYTEGTVVPITATASTGYVFDSWTGDVADPTSPTTTVTMDADQSVTANFEEEVTYDFFLYLPVILKEGSPSQSIFH
jgi:uncharacterized repeat protein (TIGR02543 family)